MSKFTAILAAMTLAASAFAQQHAGHDVLTDGEVRKIDKDARKITLKHGPIRNLDMPAHTMVLQVKEPAMLDQVKPGDKVKVQIERISGAFTITKLEVAKDPK